MVARYSMGGNGMSTKPEVSILRFNNYTKSGIFGVLSIGAVPFCFTKELPWKNNKNEVSCIPDGIYKCVSYKSKKWGNTYMLEGVPNREYVEFHWGNYLRDSHGCILLGHSFSITPEGEIMITRSKNTFETFMVLMLGISEFELHIDSIIQSGIILKEE